MRRNSIYLAIVILDLMIVGSPLRQAMAQSAREVATIVPRHVAAHLANAAFSHSPRGDDWDSDYREQEQETIRKSFTLSGGGQKSLEIDNVNGSIEVVGGASDQVQLVVNKTIRAESKKKIEEARQKVTLDITQEGDALKFYVNGPFRCQCTDCVSFHGDEGYSVKMDFQLQIPRNIEIKLKTVNGGHVRVQNVKGNFLVRNVNGGIEMQDVAGSGTARTVNGGVRVTFRENPKENSSFVSVNGSIELRFQRNMSGDFRFKTFNGGVYSDFPVTALPAHAMQEDRRDGKVIYRADRFTAARIGIGGPEIKVENLNGDIRILENHE
jgi:DUF4097 and DUF4098 domain-containing protein YvlB